MISLVAPDSTYHASFLGAAAEFESAGDYMHGSGLAPDDMADEQVRGPIFRPAQMVAAAAFEEYCAHMRSRELPEVALPLGFVPDSKLFIVDGDQFLGHMSIRHYLNDFLMQEGGHIGYSVRPSARRQGVATVALGLALELTDALGLRRVLVTCDDDNEASARTIERCGGQLEDIRNGTRRYWIER